MVNFLFPDATHNIPSSLPPHSIWQEPADRNALWQIEYYHEMISSDESEEKLLKEQSDSFLVRKSVNRERSYSLDIKHQGDVVHYLIMTNHNGYYKIVGTKEPFLTLQSLLDHYMYNPIEEGVILKNYLPCMREQHERCHTPYKSHSKPGAHTSSPAHPSGEESDSEEEQQSTIQEKGGY